MAARAKKLAARRAHMAKVARAKKVMAIAKKQGWYVQGKSLAFWTGKAAEAYKRSFMIRKRRQAVAAARARRLAIIRRRQQAILIRNGRANYNRAVKMGWVKKGGRVNFAWWANVRNVKNIQVRYQK